MHQIYVVDSRSVFRRELVLQLRDMGRSAIPYPGAVEFFDALEFIETGVVLLNTQLDDAAGQDILARLRDVRPDMAVVIMAQDADIGTAVRMIKQGACDFLELPFSPAQLTQALGNASDLLDLRVEETERRRVARERLENLSRRERDVLAALASGEDNAKVASALQLSQRTVEMHRSNIIRKCGVRRFSQAMQLAQEAGLSRSR